MDGSEKLVLWEFENPELVMTLLSSQWSSEAEFLSHVIHVKTNTQKDDTIFPKLNGE
jgi:hypothetical protein